MNFKTGLLLLLGLVPAVAGTALLLNLLGGAEITAANARLFAAPVPVTMHILAVIPYALVGALQFAPAFRRQHRRWHRMAGGVLVVCGLVAALTGLWMAHFYPWPEGDGEVLYALRLVFGTAMVTSIALSLDAIRRRDFSAHGAWMMRGYAIGMGAGTQVLTHAPYFALVGTPDEGTRAVLMGSAWVINLMVAEWIIERQRLARRCVLPGTPSTRADKPATHARQQTLPSSERKPGSAFLPGAESPPPRAQ
jgi:uncharacterized membrane protein